MVENKNLKMRRVTISIQKKTDNGFIASITIFIVLAIALLLGLSFGLLAISETNMSLEKTQSSQAYFLANLCAEQALMKLKENINYSGSEIIDIEGGNCQILPIEGNWVIKVLSNFQNQIKKTKIIIAQVNPKMIISSWQEVADF
jgi:nitrate/TMAO reductase-like tetraheme cytochrome c subunit